MADQFIRVNPLKRVFGGYETTDEIVLINVRHINSIEPLTDGEGTHIGINNYGASGYKVANSFANIADSLSVLIPKGSP